MNEAVDGDGVHLHEYYTLPMALLHSEHAKDIREAVTVRPRQIERELLATLGKSDGPVALTWDALLSIADSVESKIAGVLSGCHVFFWQHLYRRTFPTVRDEAGKVVDEVTARLVRSICEAAIVKHGRLSGLSGLEDIATADIEKVFGGWLAKSVRKVAQTPEQAELFLKHYATSHQWGIVEFEAKDLIALYYVEGLCFQYWKLTARLRAIGKGAEMVVFRDGSDTYIPDELFHRLFAIYDERAASFSYGETSGIGIWYEASKEDLLSILCFHPNAAMLDIGPIFAEQGLDLHSPDGRGFESNFVPFFLSGGDYVASHAYISDSLKEARGFTVSGAIELLHFLSVFALARHSPQHAEVHGPEKARAYELLSLCKRAYMVMRTEESSGFFQSLKTYLGSRGFAASEVGALIAAFTFTDQTRGAVSLWSRGPQFVFFPYEGATLVDLNGTVELLQNLFFKVRDDAQARGAIFEGNVRESLQARGINLEQRNFRFLDGSNAEADAVFYKDGRLVVADCFSMWRPLDFEISRPKTMAYRRRELEAKVRYALARSTKLAANPRGRNFDFASASEVLTIIVTPKVEWLWDESDLLWVAPGIPRIMQANEFISWAIDGND